MKVKTTNIFDRLIVFFIILLVFGGYGGALQPIRVFTIISIPFTFHFYIRNKSSIEYYKYELRVFFIWFFYGVVSLLWVIKPIESIKEIVYLAVNFTMFFTLIFYALNARQPKASIVTAWKWVFILTMPIAIVEFLFDVHLSISVFSDDTYMNFGDNIILHRRFASVTFGNLNSYNVILVYVLPFVLSRFFVQKDSRRYRLEGVVNWFLVITLIVFILANASRGAIVSMLIVMAVYFFYSIKDLKRLIAYSVVFIGVVAILLYTNFDVLEMAITRFKFQGFSDEGRMLVLKRSVEEFIKSGLLGIGAADFMPTMERFGIENSSPHSLFLEVLIQYGIIIFILFLGMFVRIIKKLRCLDDISYRFIIISILLVIPVVSLINSGYLPDAPTWILLASLYVISDANYKAIS